METCINKLTLLIPGLLLKEDGGVKQIRRAETLADYFATLDFPGL